MNAMWSEFNPSFNLSGSYRGQNHLLLDVALVLDRCTIEILVVSPFVVVLLGIWAPVKMTTGLTTRMKECY